MHYRRLASFVLGAWLACTVLIAAVSILALDVNAVLQSNHPDIERLVTAAKAENARALLRYHAWMLSRTLFIGWGIAQLALGFLMLGMTMAYMRPNRIIAGLVLAMIALSCFAEFVVGPEWAYSGRALDGGTDGTKVVVLQALYIGVEALKMTIGLGVAVYMFRYQSERRSRRADSKEKVISGARKAVAAEARQIAGPEES
jgi:hypothetical protein